MRAFAPTVRRLRPARGAAARGPRRPGSFPYAEDGITALVNGLAGIDEDLYLILDDFHQVDDPQAHRLVRKILELSPGNLHLVIGARTMPPLGIARLRVMGQVAEVNCADLPFELAETRAFLEQNAGSARLEPDEIVQIHDLTQGWPASLQLLSLALRNCPERRPNLRSLAWRSTDLGQYLAEDVIGDLPPRIGAFMELLSILRKFNAPLAAAVTGERDAAALIARLESENLLIDRAKRTTARPGSASTPCSRSISPPGLRAAVSPRSTSSIAAPANGSRARVWSSRRCAMPASAATSPPPSRSCSARCRRAGN